MTDSTINQYFTPVNKSLKRQKPSSSPDSEVFVTDRDMGSDEEKVGELTKGQLMSDLTAIIGKLLDTKLANVATKLDLADLSCKVTKIDEENKVQRDEIHNLKIQNKAICNKLLDLEARSRRNNLIFRGLKWGKHTKDFKHLVLQFCGDVMGNRQIVVNRAHPLGGNQDAIIAHIPYDPDIEYIMSRVRDLKGTGYAVHRDFPKEVRVKRACLAAVREEVERVAGPRRMPIMFDHLTIDRCRFTWEEGYLMAGRKDGTLQLNEMFQHDFTGFLEALRHNPAGETRRQNGAGGPPASQAATAAERTYSAATNSGGGNTRAMRNGTAATTNNAEG